MNKQVADLGTKESRVNPSLLTNEKGVPAEVSLKIY